MDFEIEMSEKELETLTEYGITYHRPMSEVMLARAMSAPGWNVYTYYWKHVRTGKIGQAKVAVRNFHEFCTLIAYWNCNMEVWQYSPFPFAL